MSVRISKEVKTIWHRDPISKHDYCTFLETKRYEVSGDLFGTTYHNTLNSANKEKQIRESINNKFPFIMPRSKREIEKCKILNLPISYPYREMETGIIINNS
jgi:hypothetical protein